MCPFDRGRNVNPIVSIQRPHGIGAIDAMFYRVEVEYRIAPDESRPIPIMSRDRSRHASKRYPVRLAKRTLLGHNTNPVRQNRIAKRSAAAPKAPERS